MRKIFITIICLLITISFVQAQHKRAFFVGISHYDNATTNYEWNDIHGVEDVKLISPLLKKQGFVTTEILDNKATYLHIKNELNKFLKSCRKGDIVYIHFSTHGQPFEDKNGDEIDAWDEAIVPFDAYKNYTKGVYEGEHHLVDDELNMFFECMRKKIGDKGYIYVVIDACHAGTSSRGDEPIRGTMIGFSSNPKKQYNPPFEHKNSYVITQMEEYSPIIFVEACRSDQINRELNTKDGVFGALSYNVAQALKQIKLSCESHQFIHAVRQSAKQQGNWPNNQNMVFEISE